MTVSEAYFNAPFDLYKNWNENSGVKNLIEILCVASFITVVIPALVFLVGRKIELKQATERDVSLAKRIFQRSEEEIEAEQKKINSYSSIGKSVEEVERDAHKGIPGAQYILGEYYLTGRGHIERHDATAMEWFVKAANQNHMLGIKRMFPSDRHPITDEKNNRITYAFRAAELNNYELQLWLAARYEEGYKEDLDRGGKVEIEKDLKLAFQWYKRAADNKNVYVYERLETIKKVAAMLEEGIGVEANFDEALVYYKKAADIEAHHGSYKTTYRDLYEQKLKQKPST